MPFWPCSLGCGRFLSSVDSHDRCLQCLGIQRAEAAFVDGLCVLSERVTMAALRSRLSLLTGMGGAPSVTTRAGFSATSREPSASPQGGLRVTVRAFCQASPHGPFSARVDGCAFPGRREIGLEACTPPSPEPSRQDDWLLGTGRGSWPRPAPVPFFPEVHEELMSLWTAPFLRSEAARLPPPSSLP